METANCNSTERWDAALTAEGLHYRERTTGITGSVSSSRHEGSVARPGPMC